MRRELVTVDPGWAGRVKRRLDGRSQRWLARSAGVSHTTLNNLLTGYSHRTSAGVYAAVERVMRALPPPARLAPVESSNGHAESPLERVSASYDRNGGSIA